MARLLIFCFVVLSALTHSTESTFTTEMVGSTESTFTVKPIGSTEFTFAIKPIVSAEPTSTVKPIASNETTFTVKPIESTEPPSTVRPIVSPEPRTVVTEASITSNGTTTEIPTDIVFSANMAPYSTKFLLEENHTKNANISDQCVKLLPGLNRMAKGIDVTTLDLFPIDIAQSSGYRKAIFDFTCAKQKTWSHPSFSDEAFSVPDQIQTITKAPAGSLNIRTKFNENIEEMKESMAAKVDIDISHWIGSFSASASYKDAKEKMLQYNKSVAETSATISSIEVDLKSPRNVKLSSYFARSIAKLPAKYEMDPKKYDTLIDLFGTHYFEVAKFGGYLYQKTIIENKYLSETKQEDISANLKLSFNSFLSLGVNMNAEFNQISNSSKANFAMNTQKNFYNYGGTTKFSTDLDKNYVAKWWDTINRNPWLFGGQLKPIENLILDPAIRREVAKATLIKRIRTYIRDFRTSVDLAGFKLSTKYHYVLKEIDEYLKGNSPLDVKTILSRGKDITNLFDKLQIMRENQKGGISWAGTIMYALHEHLDRICKGDINHKESYFHESRFVSKCKNTYFKNWKKQVNNQTNPLYCAYRCKTARCGY